MFWGVFASPVVDTAGVCARELIVYIIPRQTLKRGAGELWRIFKNWDIEKKLPNFPQKIWPEAKEGSRHA